MGAQSSDAIRRRLDRADQHRQDINAALEVWRKQNPNPVTGYGHPQKTEHHFHLTFNVKPDLIRWGLMFGDAVHNLRAALDNVVWEVALRDSGDNEPLRRTQFPIFLNEEEFFSRVTGKRSGLSQIDSIKNPDVRAIIERVQPWQRSQAPDQDHLWVVHQFDREDKHQVITPILVLTRQLESAVVIEHVDEATARSALPPMLSVKDGPLEDGTEFLTVYTPTPPEKVQMQHKVDIGIGVTMSGETGGIGGTLGKLCKHVRGVVEELLDCLT